MNSIPMIYLAGSCSAPFDTFAEAAMAAEAAATHVAVFKGPAGWVVWKADEDRPYLDSAAAIHPNGTGTDRPTLGIDWDTASSLSFDRTVQG